MPRRVVVVTHPHLGEPEAVQGCFGAIDPTQDLDRDGGAVRDTAGQARGRRLVPGAQADRLRSSPHVGLGEARGHERELGARLGRRALAGPMIAQVVDVDTQHHRGGLSGGDRTDDVHQLGLAVVAAVGVVQPVGSSLHLVGGDRRPTQTPFGCQRGAVGLLVTGERW